jgi:hypothetical protein
VIEAGEQMKRYGPAAGNLRTLLGLGVTPRRRGADCPRVSDPDDRLAAMLRQRNSNSRTAPSPFARTGVLPNALSGRRRMRRLRASLASIPLAPRSAKSSMDKSALSHRLAPRARNTESSCPSPDQVRGRP